MSTTTTPELTKQLTSEEIDKYDQRSEEIAKELGVNKVHPVVFINPTTLERTVCYLSEPNFQTKLAIMDKALMMGVYQAGEELMRTCVVKEYSDSITYSEHSASDDYRMGVIDYCLQMINRYQNQFKKK